METLILLVFNILMLSTSKTVSQVLDPDDLVTPTMVSGMECDDITLTCQLVGGGRSLSRGRMFSWSKQDGAWPGNGDNININDCRVDEIGAPLDNDNSRYALAKDNVSCNLTIKAALLSDAGCYQCDSWGHSGGVCNYVEVKVIETVRQVSLWQTSPQIIENIPATFACSAGYGTDEVEVHWTLDGENIPEEMRQAEGGVDCMGRNETVFEVDLALGRNRSGSILVCELRGEGQTGSINASLTIGDIQVPPTSVRILHENTGKIYNETGRDALVQQYEAAPFCCCVAGTRPTAIVSWVFKGSMVAGSVETRLQDDGTTDVMNTVVLTDVSWMDDGEELVCCAVGAGDISVCLAVRIIVDAPPQNVTLSSTSVFIVESAPNVFICSAGQTRTASFMVWYLDDIYIASSNESQNTSYSEKRLETTSALSLSLWRDQAGSRLRCDVMHKLLSHPMKEEMILDVYFCSLPSLSCPAVLSTSESYNITCVTHNSRPPSNLSLYIDMPFRPLDADGYWLRHEPSEYQGVMTEMTVELTGDRKDHWRTVVCRRNADDEICREVEFDRCILDVHFPPLLTSLMDGSSREGDAELGKRIIDVFDGREYVFVCGAFGSNPAATFRWLLASKEVHGAVHTKIAVPQWGWNATSRLALTVVHSEHHAQKLTCEILYPTSQEVFQRRSLEFNVISVSTDWTMLIVVIACSSAIVLVVIPCLFVLLHKTHRCQRGRFSMNSEIELKELNVRSRLGKGASKQSVSSQGTGRSSISGSEAYEFPRNKLRLCEVIGSGSYGLVYKATAEGIFQKGVCSTVAVKTPNPSSSPVDKEDFLKELEMYTVLVQHPNVVSMLGYCRKKDPVYLIMEYVPNGNLESYLRREKHHMDKSYTNLHGMGQAIDPALLLGFASQIVQGMKYLASVQCIHRDLATRNILLDDQFRCKVSDFGLARHVPTQQQYEMTSQGRVPFRWMAPESIMNNVYTTQTDVWSFGVLLWELITLGSHPYPGLSCTEILENLKRGIRLQKPAHCSDEFYQLMLDCWEGKPSARPNFEMLNKTIETMLANASGYLSMSNFSVEQYEYMAPGSK